jgi:hypothetical protein
VALEPVLLRAKPARDLFGWQRGETTASPAEIMAYNGITARLASARGVGWLSRGIRQGPSAEGSEREHGRAGAACLFSIRR